MAASSSDESSIAPRNFVLTSSVDSDSHLDSHKAKCPLCCNMNNTFYCKKCVRNGSFYSTLTYESYSYATKELELLRLKSIKKQMLSDTAKLIEDRQKYEELMSDIRERKERIRIYKLTLEEKRKEIEADMFKLHEMRICNDDLKMDLPKYARQVDLLETRVLSKMEKGAQISEQIKNSRLKEICRYRIKQALDYVFIVERVQPKSVDVEEADTDDVASAITEAVCTTYVSKDRWVYTDNSSELQYSIIAPLLPSSGNYEAYNIWVAQTRGGVPGNSTSQEHHPAYSISAALTYTAQFVSVLAFFLDIRLPYKMSYVDFCTKEMECAQFSRRVSRLNANILHLCYSQNVDLSTLNPVQSLQNILQLVDEKIDFGNFGPFEVDRKVAGALENQIDSTLLTGEDSDSEEGDAYPYEWEAVPHVQLPEASPGPMNQASTQTLSTQQGQMNSIAGGLYTSAANSLASIWKGFTGR